MRINSKNIIRVLFYGWRDSGRISKSKDINKPRILIYLDMIKCYRKYQTLTSQYCENKMWKLSNADKENVGENLKKINVNRDFWEDTYYKNWKFLNKYSSLKWESTPKKRQKRANAYIKHFGLGKHTKVQYGVKFICEHHNVGKLIVGDNCLFARECDIDYTGDLTIGNDVTLAEGVKVITHEHDSYHFMVESDLIPFSNRAYKTNLKIGDMVSVGTHAIIMPGVREIGENSIVSAGSVVTRPVPSNVIVAGNPATVVRKIPSIVNRTKH